MTLTEFLLARIREDELVALLCEEDGSHWCSNPGGWGAGAVEATDHPQGDTGIVVYDEGRPNSAQAEHIARHDPARALAECAAKEVIANLHANRYDLGDCVSCADGWEDLTYGNNGYSPEPYPCLTLRNLALPYADHPDYREEWKP